MRFSFRLTKIVALATAVFFTWQTASAYALPALSFVPKAIASVDSESTSNHQKSALLLLNAHTSSDAQKNISELLKFLQSQGVDLIGLEGADDKIDGHMFRDFPDKDALAKASWQMVKEGIFTGAEHFYITADKLPEFYGLEDKALYFENRDAFINTVRSRENLSETLKSLSDAFGALKKKIYSGSLYDFDRMVYLYQQGDLSFLDYLDKTVQAAKKARLSLSNYPNLYALSKAMEHERKISQKGIDKDLEQLENKLAKSDIDSSVFELIRNKNSAAGDEILESYQKIHAYFSDLVKENKFTLSEYKEISKFYKWLESFLSFDAKKLFDELDSVTGAVYEKWAKSDKEKTLLELASQFENFEKMLSIELTQKEWEKNKSSFDVEKAISFFSSELKNRAPEVSSADIELIREAGSQGAQFYGLAEKRNAIFAEKILGAMEKGKKDVTAVVIGGFHEKGLKEALEARGISASVLSPKIAGSASDIPYMERMLGTPSELETITKELTSALELGQKISGITPVETQNQIELGELILVGAYQIQSAEKTNRKNIIIGLNERAAKISGARINFQTPIFSKDGFTLPVSVNGEDVSLKVTESENGLNIKPSKFQPVTPSSVVEKQNRQNYFTPITRGFAKSSFVGASAQFVNRAEVRAKRYEDPHVFIDAIIADEAEDGLSEILERAKAAGFTGELSDVVLPIQVTNVRTQSPKGNTIKHYTITFKTPRTPSARPETRVNQYITVAVIDNLVANAVKGNVREIRITPDIIQAGLPESQTISLYDLDLAISEYSHISPHILTPIPSEAGSTYLIGDKSVDRSEARAHDLRNDINRLEQTLSQTIKKRDQISQRYLAAGIDSEETDLELEILESNILDLKDELELLNTFVRHFPNIGIGRNGRPEYLPNRSEVRMTNEERLQERARLIKELRAIAKSPLHLQDVKNRAAAHREKLITHADEKAISTAQEFIKKTRAEARAESRAIHLLEYNPAISISRNFQNFGHKWSDGEDNIYSGTIVGDAGTSRALAEANYLEYSNKETKVGFYISGVYGTDDELKIYLQTGMNKKPVNYGIHIIEEKDSLRIQPLLTIPGRQAEGSEIQIAKEDFLGVRVDLEREIFTFLFRDEKAASLLSPSIVNEASIAGFQTDKLQIEITNRSEARNDKNDKSEEESEGEFRERIRKSELIERVKRMNWEELKERRRKIERYRNSDDPRRSEARMQVLGRKIDERIIIGNNISVMVVDIRGNSVRLGINAPKDISVNRSSIYEAKKNRGEPIGAYYESADPRTPEDLIKIGLVLTLKTVGDLDDPENLITIGDNEIRMGIVGIDGSKARLGINASPDIPVLRSELYFRAEARSPRRGIWDKGEEGNKGNERVNAIVDRLNAIESELTGLRAAEIKAKGNIKLSLPLSDKIENLEGEKDALFEELEDLGDRGIIFLPRAETRTFKQKIEQDIRGAAKRYPETTLEEELLIKADELKHSDKLPENLDKFLGDLYPYVYGNGRYDRSEARNDQILNEATEFIDRKLLSTSSSSDLANPEMATVLEDANRIIQAGNKAAGTELIELAVKVRLGLNPAKDKKLLRAARQLLVKPAAPPVNSGKKATRLEILVDVQKMITALNSELHLDNSTNGGVSKILKNITAVKRILNLKDKSLPIGDDEVAILNKEFASAKNHVAAQKTLAVIEIKLTGTRRYLPDAIDWLQQKISRTEVRTELVVAGAKFTEASDPRSAFPLEVKFRNQDGSGAYTLKAANPEDFDALELYRGTGRPLHYFFQRDADDPMGDDSGAVEIYLSQRGNLKGGAISHVEKSDNIEALAAWLEKYRYTPWSKINSVFEGRSEARNWAKAVLSASVFGSGAFSAVQLNYFEMAFFLAVAGVLTLTVQLGELRKKPQETHRPMPLPVRVDSIDQVINEFYKQYPDGWIEQVELHSEFGAPITFWSDTTYINDWVDELNPENLEKWLTEMAKEAPELQKFNFLVTFKSSPNYRNRHWAVLQRLPRSEARMTEEERLEERRRLIRELRSIEIDPKYSDALKSRARQYATDLNNNADEKTIDQAQQFINESRSEARNLQSAIKEMTEWKATNEKTLLETLPEDPFYTRLQEKARSVFDHYRLDELKPAERLRYVNAIYDKARFPQVNARINDIYNRLSFNKKATVGAMKPESYLELGRMLGDVERVSDPQENRLIRSGLNRIFDHWDREKRILELEAIVTELDRELKQSGSGNLPVTGAMQDLHGGAKRAMSLAGFAIARAASRRRQPKWNWNEIYQHFNTLDELKQLLMINQIDPTQSGVRIAGLNDKYDRGDDPAGAFNLVQWLHEIGIGKPFIGNHELWRTMSVLGIHFLFERLRVLADLAQAVKDGRSIKEIKPQFDSLGLSAEELEQAAKEFDLSLTDLGKPVDQLTVRDVILLSKKIKFKGHHAAHWAEDAFKHAGWGDIELEQINQDRFNRALSAINRTLTQRGISPFAELDLAQVRARFEAELKTAKAHNTKVRQSIQAGETTYTENDYKPLPDIFTESLNELRSRKAQYNREIQALNRSHQTDLPGIEFQEANLDNYWRDPTVIERTLWELKNWKLFYINILGGLQMHNILPIDYEKGGFDVTYRGLKGLPALELIANDISSYFWDYKTEDLIFSSQTSRRQMWDSLGEAFEVMNKWYSDVDPVAKAPAVRKFIDEGGLAAFGKPILGVNTRYREREVSLGMHFGHNERGKFLKQGVELPWIYVYPESGMFIINEDDEMSKGYQDRGSIVTFFLRDENGKVTGLRRWGYRKGSSVIEDLTLDEINGLNGPQVEFLKMLSDGKNFMAWYRDKALRRILEDASRLHHEAIIKGREDKADYFREMMTSTQTRLQSGAPSSRAEVRALDWEALTTTVPVIVLGVSAVALFAWVLISKYREYAQLKREEHIKDLIDRLRSIHEVANQAGARAVAENRRSDPDFVTAANANNQIKYLTTPPVSDRSIEHAEQFIEAMEFYYPARAEVREGDDASSIIYLRDQYFINVSSSGTHKIVGQGYQTFEEAEAAARRFAGKSIIPIRMDGISDNNPDSFYDLPMRLDLPGYISADLVYDPSARNILVVVLDRGNSSIPMEIGRFTLTPGKEMTLGRSSDSTIQINIPVISRKQVSIKLDQNPDRNGVLIKHEGSNETWFGTYSFSRAEARDQNVIQWISDGSAKENVLDEITRQLEDREAEITFFDIQAVKLDGNPLDKNRLREKPLIPGQLIELVLYPAEHPELFKFSAEIPQEMNFTTSSGTGVKLMLNRSSESYVSYGVEVGGYNVGFMRIDLDGENRVTHVDVDSDDVNVQEIGGLLRKNILGSKLSLKTRIENRAEARNEEIGNKILSAIADKDLREATRLYVQNRNLIENSERQKLKQAIYELRQAQAFQAKQPVPAQYEIISEAVLISGLVALGTTQAIQLATLLRQGFGDDSDRQRATEMLRSEARSNIDTAKELGSTYSSDFFENISSAMIEAQIEAGATEFTMNPYSTGKYIQHLLTLLTPGGQQSAHQILNLDSNDSWQEFKKNLSNLPGPIQNAIKAAMEPTPNMTPATELETVKTMLKSMLGEAKFIEMITDNADEANKDGEALYWDITDYFARKIAGRLSSNFPSAIYEKSEGKTGYVSVEVDPRIERIDFAKAREAKKDPEAWMAERMRAEAEMLKEIAPNVLVKVPATRAGFETLRHVDANFNVTLQFTDTDSINAIDAFESMKDRKGILRNSPFVSRNAVYFQEFWGDRLKDADGHVATMVNTYETFEALKAWGYEDSAIWSSLGVKVKGDPGWLYAWLVAGSAILNAPTPTAYDLNQADISIVKNFGERSLLEIITNYFEWVKNGQIPSAKTAFPELMSGARSPSEQAQLAIEEWDRLKSLNLTLEDIEQIRKKVSELEKASGKKRPFTREGINKAAARIRNGETVTEKDLMSLILQSEGEEKFIIPFQGAIDSLNRVLQSRNEIPKEFVLPIAGLDHIKLKSSDLTRAVPGEYASYEIILPDGSNVGFLRIDLAEGNRIGDKSGFVDVDSDDAAAKRVGDFLGRLWGRKLNLRNISGISEDEFKVYSSRIEVAEGAKKQRRISHTQPVRLLLANKFYVDISFSNVSKDFQISVRNLDGQIIDEPRNFKFDQVIKIGRNPDENDIIILSPSISREHLRIKLIYDVGASRIDITDLGSTNGTQFAIHPARRSEARNRMPTESQIRKLVRELYYQNVVNGSLVPLVVENKTFLFERNLYSEWKLKGRDAFIEEGYRAVEAGFTEREDGSLHRIKPSTGVKPWILYRATSGVSEDRFIIEHLRRNVRSEVRMDEQFDAEVAVLQAQARDLISANQAVALEQLLHQHQTDLERELAAYVLGQLAGLAARRNVTAHTTFGPVYNRIIDILGRDYIIEHRYANYFPAHIARINGLARAEARNERLAILDDINNVITTLKRVPSTEESLAVITVLQDAHDVFIQGPEHSMEEGRIDQVSFALEELEEMTKTDVMLRQIGVIMDNPTTKGRTISRSLPNAIRVIREAVENYGQPSDVIKFDSDDDSIRAEARNKKEAHQDNLSYAWSSGNFVYENINVFFNIQKAYKDENSANQAKQKLQEFLTAHFKEHNIASLEDLRTKVGEEGKDLPFVQGLFVEYSNAERSGPRKGTLQGYEFEIFAGNEKISGHISRPARSEARAIVDLKNKAAIYFNNGIWLAVNQVDHIDRVVHFDLMSRNPVSVDLGTEIISHPGNWEKIPIQRVLAVSRAKSFLPENKIIVAGIDIAAKSTFSPDYAMAISIMTSREIEYDRGGRFAEEALGSLPEGALTQKGSRVWISQSDTSFGPVTISLNKKSDVRAGYDIKIGDFPTVWVVNLISGTIPNPLFGRIESLIKSRTVQTEIPIETRAEARLAEEREASLSWYAPSARAEARMSVKRWPLHENTAKNEVTLRYEFDFRHNPELAAKFKEIKARFPVANETFIKDVLVVTDLEQTQIVQAIRIGLYHGEDSFTRRFEINHENGEIEVFAAHLEGKSGIKIDKIKFAWEPKDYWLFDLLLDAIVTNEDVPKKEKQLVKNIQKKIEQRISDLANRPAQDTDSVLSTPDEPPSASASNTVIAPVLKEALPSGIIKTKPAPAVSVQSILKSDEFRQAYHQALNLADKTPEAQQVTARKVIETYFSLQETAPDALLDSSAIYYAEKPIEVKGQYKFLIPGTIKRELISGTLFLIAPKGQSIPNAEDLKLLRQNFANLKRVVGLTLRGSFSELIAPITKVEQTLDQNTDFGEARKNIASVLNTFTTKADTWARADKEAGNKIKGIGPKETRRLQDQHRTKHQEGLNSVRIAQSEFQQTLKLLDELVQKNQTAPVRAEVRQRKGGVDNFQKVDVNTLQLEKTKAPIQLQIATTWILEILQGLGFKPSIRYSDRKKGFETVTISLEKDQFRLNGRPSFNNKFEISRLNGQDQYKINIYTQYRHRQGLEEIYKSEGLSTFMDFEKIINEKLEIWVNQLPELIRNYKVSTGANRAESRAAIQIDPLTTERFQVQSVQQLGALRIEKGTLPIEKPLGTDGASLLSVVPVTKVSPSRNVASGVSVVPVVSGPQAISPVERMVAIIEPQLKNSKAILIRLSEADIDQLSLLAGLDKAGFENPDEQIKETVQALATLFALAELGIQISIAIPNVNTKTEGALKQAFDSYRLAYGINLPTSVQIKNFDENGAAIERTLNQSLAEQVFSITTISEAQALAPKVSKSTFIVSDRASGRSIESGLLEKVRLAVEASLLKQGVFQALQEQENIWIADESLFQNLAQTLTLFRQAAERILAAA